VTLPGWALKAERAKRYSRTDVQAGFFFLPDFCNKIGTKRNAGTAGWSVAGWLACALTYPYQ
jgi:hypothetical protein